MIFQKIAGNTANKISVSNALLRLYNFRKQSKFFIQDGNRSPYNYPFVQNLLSFRLSKSKTIALIFHIFLENISYLHETIKLYLNDNFFRTSQILNMKHYKVAHNSFVLCRVFSS